MSIDEIFKEAVSRPSVNLDEAEAALVATAPAGWKVSRENFGADLGDMIHLVHIESNTHVPIGIAGPASEEWAEITWVFALDYFESDDDYFGVKHD